MVCLVPFKPLYLEKMRSCSGFLSLNYLQFDIFASEAMEVLTEFNTFFDKKLRCLTHCYSTRGLKGTIENRQAAITIHYRIGRGKTKYIKNHVLQILF